MATPSCKHFGTCGGCISQDIDYLEQLRRKSEIIGSLFPLPHSSPSPYPFPGLLPSPEVYFYRNRMDFAFGPKYSVGLKDAKSNIINIEKCWLMSEKTTAILNRLRYFISFKKLAAHKEGIMRHAVVREAKNSKNCIINILTSDKGIFPLEEFWEKTQDLFDGVVWSINSSPADRSYGEIQQSFGQDFLWETLNGIKFKIPVQSFFQTNTHQAENLLKVVKEFAALTGAETVLDLYSGTGSLGLYLADKAKAVIGIEENAPAAQLSIENAKINHIANYSALAGRVEDLIGEIVTQQPSLVVLDPPRPGVHKKVIAKLGRTRPAKIIYVSCNPQSQKHDVDKLQEWGYKIEKCQPLDMFPHTPHIENVLLLKLA